MIKISGNNIQLTSPTGKIFFVTKEHLRQYFPYIKSVTSEHIEDLKDTETGKMKSRLPKLNSTIMEGIKVNYKQTKLGTITDEYFDRVCNSLEEGTTLSISSWKLKVVEFDYVKR